MIYSEASYFDGYHFQHIAAWKEELRLKGIDKRNAECFNRRLRQRDRNRANEEGKDQGEVAASANREDVRSLQARLCQQI